MMCESRRGRSVGKTRSSSPFGQASSPLPQCADQHRRQGDDAFTRRRLWLANLVVTVGALAHVQLVALEVDIGPAQAAQLGGS